MKFRYIAIALIFFSFFSCSKTEKVEEGKTSPPEATSKETTETTSTTTKVEEGNSNLTATGSSLTGGESNLNLDIQLSADQLFDFDKAVLKPAADAELEKALIQFKNQPKSIVTVIGYTDGKGSESYNKDLSLRRANAVKSWFESHGYIGAINVEGKGAEDPIAPNTNADGSDNPEGRAKNRRVEIKVKGSKSL